MSPRWLVLRAADAPAPTIVVDGSSLRLDADRAEAEALLREARDDALAAHALDLYNLGVKNAVVFAPSGGVLRVEFFQGLANGPLMAGSQLVCVNSLACAVVAACGWHAELVDTAPWTALMASTAYLLRPDAA